MAKNWSIPVIPFHGGRYYSVLLCFKRVGLWLQKAGWERFWWLAILEKKMSGRIVDVTSFHDIEKNEPTDKNASIFIFY